MATVVFSSQQRKLTEGLAEIDVPAARVTDLIAALEDRFPDLQGLLDGLAVAIDGDIHQNARFMALAPDAEVHFLGAVAGGSGSKPEVAHQTATVHPFETALAWANEGRNVVLATVLETWGSSPCPAGSVLVISGSGEFEGSVSGGCVESAVVEAALAMTRTTAPQILDFDVADETAWDVGLACGGRVAVRIERLE